MNVFYSDIEQEIVNHLSPVFDGGAVDVVQLPQVQAEFQRPFGAGRVTVAYKSSDFGDVQSTYEITQDEMVQIEIVVQSRSLRGNLGLHAITEAVKRRLVGFRPTDCSKMYLVKNGFTEHNNETALWAYSMVFQTRYTIVEDKEYNTEPGLTEVSFEYNDEFPEIPPIPFPGTFPNPPIIAYKGDIAYWDGEVWRRLSPGEAGFVLATNGQGEIPEWVSPQSGPQGPQGPAGPTAVSANANNQATLGTDGLIFVPPASAPSGPFGIANTSGVYTYYSTLPAAMTAAVSGQTIEMFADVTETGSVTITLKNGVSINGNGHTYLLSAANTTHAFVTPNSVSGYEFNFLNTIVKRTNSTGAAGACVLIGINCEGRITFNGTVLINTGAGAGISFLSYNGNVQIYNATVFTNSGNGIQVNSNSPSTKIVNCKAYSASGIAIFAQSFCDIVNCIGESNSGTGIHSSSQNCSNSFGRSNSGYGISSSGGVFWSCTGLSSSSYGAIGTNAGYFYNCSIYSSGSIGLYLYNAESFTVRGCNVFSGSNVAVYFSGAIAAHKIDIHNTLATSNANFAFATGNGSITLYNCSGETLASSCLSAKNSIYGGVFRSKWNNAAGHVITIGAVSQFDIIGTILIASNTSANAIYSANLVTLNFAQNSYKGITTPTNANITQGQTNTHDNFGNIKLG